MSGPDGGIEYGEMLEVVDIEGKAPQTNVDPQSSGRETRIRHAGRDASSMLDRTWNNEEDYRHALLDTVVQQTAGRVGVYTTLDLTLSERHVIEEKIKARGGTPPPSIRSVSEYGHGYTEYGEIPVIGGKAYTSPEQYLLHRKQISQATDKEAIGFMYPSSNSDQEMVDVRYTVKSSRIKDNANRPTTDYVMGFQLPVETARILQEAIQKDPSYARDVVRRQLEEMGFSERVITALKPKFPDSRPIDGVKGEVSPNVSLDYGVYRMPTEGDSPEVIEEMPLSLFDRKSILPTQDAQVVEPEAPGTAVSVDDVQEILDTMIGEDFHESYILSVLLGNQAELEWQSRIATDKVVKDQTFASSEIYESVAGEYVQELIARPRGEGVEAIRAYITGKISEFRKVMDAAGLSGLDQQLLRYEGDNDTLWKIADELRILDSLLVDTEFTLDAQGQFQRRR